MPLKQTPPGVCATGRGVAAPPLHGTAVCATGRGVAAPPLLLVANIVLFRVQGCEEGLEIQNPCWWDLEF
jgi:hypothetical protein